MAELSYEELVTAEGRAASQQFFAPLLRSEELLKTGRNRLRRDLPNYCTADTWALVNAHP